MDRKRTGKLSGQLESATGERIAALDGVAKEAAFGLEPSQDRDASHADRMDRGHETVLPADREHGHEHRPWHELDWDLDPELAERSAGRVPRCLSDNSGDKRGVWCKPSAAFFTHRAATDSWANPLPPCTGRCRICSRTRGQVAPAQCRADCRESRSCLQTPPQGLVLHSRESCGADANAAHTAKDPARVAAGGHGRHGTTRNGGRVIVPGVDELSDFPGPSHPLTHDRRELSTLHTKIPPVVGTHVLLTQVHVS